MIAVIRAFRAVGWELISAVNLRTDSVQVWSLKEGSPAMLKTLYRKRWAVIQAAQALGHRFTNLAGQSHETQELIDKGIDLLPMK